MLKLFNLYMPNYYQKNKFTIFTFIIASLIFIILESIVAPFYLGKIINNLNKPTKYLIILILIYGLVFIFYLIKKSQEKTIIPDLLTYSRSKMFQAIIDKYSEDYKSIKMGSTISKINMITQIFKECYLHFITEIGPHFIIIFGIGMLFLFFDYKIGLSLLITNFLIILVIFLNIKYIKNLKLRCEETYYQVDNHLVDTYTSLLNTYLNNNIKNDKQKINQNQKSYNLKYKDVNKKENQISYIMYFISLCFFLLTLGYLFKFNTAKIKLKIILIILLIYYLSSLLFLSKKISWWLPHYVAVEGNRSFIQDLTIFSSNIGDENINSGYIQFKNVFFKYSSKGKYILNDINLEIKDRQKVAIIGKSGKGKSTLSLLLLKLYLYQGQIFIDNVDIKKINTNYLRTKILYCNQKTLLYDMSIIDNMSFGNNYSYQDIINILEKYDLIDAFNNLSSGIHHNAGVLGNNLSGGMQKVVMIMRTLLKVNMSNPYIVIFDEPLSALDSLTRKKIIKIIVDFCKNKTLIIITHDTEIIPYMDKVIDFNKINR